MKVTLEELVGKERVASFVREHLLGGQHFVTQAPMLAEYLGTLPGLASVSQLIEKLDRVWVFGPGGQRELVAAAEAEAYYDRGYGLYAEGIGEVIPELPRMTRRLCGQLGIHPQWVRFECFAARAGAVSSLHYDHESNFQILLRGCKRWKLAPNRSIENPRLAHHRLENPLEESLAHTLPVPKEIDQYDCVHVAEGDIVFFPLGYWHEVTSESETLALNIVIKPPRLCESLGEALCQELARNPRMREPTMGLVGGEIHEDISGHAAGLLRDAKKTLHEAVDALSLRDLGLVFENMSVRWADAAKGRRLDVADGRAILSCELLDSLVIASSDIALVQTLLPFRGSFTLEQLRGLAPECSAEHLLVTMLQMRGQGYWEDNLEQ